MKLAVFDFNGVLLKRDQAPIINNKRADVRVGFKYVYFRPHLAKLLEFLQKETEAGRLQVAFWTSSEPHNAAKLMAALDLESYNIRPLFLWSRLECTKLAKQNWGDEYATAKPMARIIKKYWPEFDGDGLIFDDSPVKLSLTNPEAAVLVKTYVPDAEDTDTELLRLIDVLKAFTSRDRAI